MWRVTIRTGPKVERSAHEQLDDALTEIAAACRTAPRLDPVDLRYRTYEPAERVAVRAEVSGPTRLLPRVRAGVDVRGDGSAEAWTGRVGRRPIEPEPGEDAHVALRRVLATG